MIDVTAIRRTALGSGRPIVFLHGWTMDHRDEALDFEPVFAGRAGWRRIYPDLPGMGQSPRQPDIADMDGMLEATLAVIEAEVGDQRFVVAGTSAGAYLARGVVRRLGGRIDGLLLRAPLVVANDRDRDVDPFGGPLLAVAGEAPSDADRAELGEIIVERGSYIEALKRKQRERVAPAQALADGAFLEPIRSDPARYSFSFDVDDLSAPFPAPALILTGRQDSSVGFRDAWRLLPAYPRASYLALDRAEHGMPIDQQPLFRALVCDWLDRVEEYAACHP